MYIWGGHFQRKYLNDLCAFNVRECEYKPAFVERIIFNLVDLDPSKAEWNFIPYENQGPSPRSGHVSVIYENKLYM
jgi:hypothetical protein